MRIKLQFTFIDHIMRIFLLLLALLFVLIFLLFWLFRMDITAPANGKIVCSQWIDVTPEVDGMITHMNVKEAQHVKKGALLFTLEDRERKLETQSSLQKIAEIHKHIETLKQTMSIREESITNAIAEAQAFLNEARAAFRIIQKGPKPEEIDLGQGSIDRARQQVKKASLDFDRMAKAFSLKLVSRQELDNFSHQKDLALTDLALAQGKLALLMNKYDKNELAMAQARITRQKVVLSSALARNKELDILKQELAIALKALTTEENRLEALTKKLALTKILAPLSGIIMTYDTQHLEGKAVVKGESVLKIGSTHDYRVECQVSEKDFALVKIGQKARVAIKPFPKGEYKLFTATVLTTGIDSRAGGPSSDIGIQEKISTMISGPSALQENYYPVMLALEKPYHMMVFGNRYEVKPGFSAEAAIIVEDERIATLLFKRVLRIKGRLTRDNIHL